jgi:hypothetical protein
MTCTRLKNRANSIQYWQTEPLMSSTEERVQIAGRNEFEPYNFENQDVF